MAKGRKTGGRKKGTPNKITQALKDAILEAANLAGNEDGLTGYLHKQANMNPVAFMSLLGRVLPLQVGGDPDNPIHAIHRIERIIVRPKDSDSRGL